MNVNSQNQIQNIVKPDFNFDFSNGPKIMGIVNITPDSFYDGGRYSNSIDAAVNYALKMVEDGADILDIGGESSRPSAEPVSESEEIDRILPVIEGIRKKNEIPISVDTYKSKVAMYAIESGADWINDISGFRFDDSMVEIAEKYNCPVVIMHMQGTPQSMQINPVYDDVVSELIDYFSERIESLNQANIKNLIIDPGIGFGKSQNHNLEILNQIDRFKDFGLPVLVGASRKSFIGNILDNKVEERLPGSLAVISWLSIQGVDLVRVHDVKESLEVIKTTKLITNSKINQFK